MKSHRGDKVVEKLRIFVIGNQGHAYALLEYLKKNNGCEIIGLCTKIQKPIPFKQKIRIALSKLLSDLNIRQPKMAFYRNPFDDFGDIHSFAKTNNIPVYPSYKLDKHDFQEMLKDLKPHLIICCGFHRLVPDFILDIPSLVAINYHTGCLPERGGGTPVRWAIYHGDKHVCYSAHIMTGGYDEGEVIAQKKVIINDNDDWGKLENKLHNVIPDLTGDVIELARQKRLQKSILASVSPNIEPPFHGVYQNIDWSKDGHYIARTCRAMRPKSGAFAFWENKKIVLWSVGLVINKTQDEKLRPGEVYDVDDAGNPLVYAINHSICIKEYLDGRKIRSGAHLMKKGLEIGSRFE